MVGGPNRRAPNADVFWPPDPAASVAGDQNVVYPGPCDPDRSFSEELSEGEVKKWILKVLDQGANLNLGAGPVPLRERVTSTRVSTFVCLGLFR
jgi:hypothetical protein